MTTPVRVLRLETLPGMVDVLAEELASGGLGRVVRRWPHAVLVETSSTDAALGALPYFSAASVWTAVPATASDAPELVVEAMRAAVPAGTAFRVSDVGERRWEVRDALLAAGFANSTGAWDVNVDVVDDVLVLTLGALHTTRRFGELARIPASTNPVLAAGLVRLAKVRPGAVVLDPFCGAGTNLVAAAYARPDDVRLVGLDVKTRALGSCRANAVARGFAVTTAQANAARLPLADQGVDRVVTNMPFGKRVGSHADNERLYPAFCRELGRVLRNDGRAVLLTEDKRLLVDAVQRTAGLKIVREAVFEIGGLHPSAYVVERSRKVRAPRSR